MCITRTTLNLKYHIPSAFHTHWESTIIITLPLGEWVGLKGCSVVVYL